MTRHEHEETVHVVQDGYTLDTLGAPFSVVLFDGYELRVDPKTGEEVVNVIDMIGLIGAVVRSRVEHPRKLSGQEIKFVRDAVGVKAKVLAEFLGMTPEHLSRCENGSKVMSMPSEKLFRVSTWAATLLKEPADAFVLPTEEQFAGMKNELKDGAAKQLNNLFSSLFSIKIDPVYPVNDEPLKFEFRRVKMTTEGAGDDDNWSPEIRAA